MTAATMESLNVKIDAEDKRLFAEYTSRLGTTPSNAVRMFVKAFNEFQGFPFETSRPYHVSAEAQRSYAEAVTAIENGSAKRYQSFADVIAEIDEEIRAEDEAHA